MTIPQRLVFMSAALREVKKQDVLDVQDWGQLSRAIWAGWGEQ